MKILIITNSGSQYWTEETKEEGNFLMFETTSKEGKVRKIKINKEFISEMIEMEGELNNEE